MLVFYTWSIRLLAESIGLFGSAEKLTWLANHTPQEGGRLAPPALPGAAGKGKAKSRGCCAPSDPNDTTGISLPPAKVCVFTAFACAMTRQPYPRLHPASIPLVATACGSLPLC